VARVLIVGCGGRGRALARELVAAGHAVRGTTRDPERVAAIAAVGAEGYVGDPDRIATLMEAIAGVTVVAWLLGSAGGESAADLHAGRLRMLCEKLVDTPVRGLLYEGAGTLPDEVLAGGAEIVRAAAATWSIPVEVLATAPEDCDAWTRDALAAVEGLLAG
jgi:NADP-dependent 3-hydroxy acid dehydrogenase YdfG